MSKTKEELSAIKEDVETVNKKLRELTPEELEKVTGGFALTSKLDVAPGLAEMEVIAKRVSAPLIK